MPDSPEPTEQETAFIARKSPKCLASFIGDTLGATVATTAASQLAHPQQKNTQNQTSSQPSPVMDRVDSLRRQLAGLVTLDQEQKTTISWGCAELDQWMPGGALQPGMIVELLYDQRGSGVGSLALHAAKQAIADLQAPLVVVDRKACFYPPAAVARGIEPHNLIMVRPAADPRITKTQGEMSAAEELWALDQALRCPGVAVVMAWMDKIDPNAYRRLQLAAEAGQTLVLLIRPEHVQASPTWSDVQLLVSPRSNSPAWDRPDYSEHRFCQVTLLRQRGRAGSHTIEGTRLNLRIDQQGTLQVCAGNVHEARTMHMAPGVAYPATRRRSAGA